MNKICIDIFSFAALQQSAGGIKWSAVGFAIIEVIFFILKAVIGVVPSTTPTVSDLNLEDEQNFTWDKHIYRKLNYFMFTVVGGIVYLCVLFLYVHQLGSGDEEFAKRFSIPLPLLTAATSGSATNPSGPLGAASSSQQQRQPPYSNKDPNQKKDSSFPTQLLNWSKSKMQEPNAMRQLRRHFSDTSTSRERRRMQQQPLPQSQQQSAPLQSDWSTSQARQSTPIPSLDPPLPLASQQPPHHHQTSSTLIGPPPMSNQSSTGISLGPERVPPPLHSSPIRHPPGPRGEGDVRHQIQQIPPPSASAGHHPHGGGHMVDSSSDNPYDSHHGNPSQKQQPMYRSMNHISNSSSSRGPQNPRFYNHYQPPPPILPPPDHPHHFNNNGRRMVEEPRGRRGSFTSSEFDTPRHLRQQPPPPLSDEAYYHKIPMSPPAYNYCLT